MIRTLGLIVGLLAPCGALASGAHTLVDERFADGERQTFAPPASLAWRVSGPESGRMVDGRMQVGAPTRGVSTAVAHLLPAGQAVEVPAGGQLVLQVRLVPREPVVSSVNGLRVGLMQVGNRRIQRDGPPPMLQASGYVATIDPSPARAGILLRRRTGENGPLIGSLRDTLYTNLAGQGRGRGMAWSEGAAVDLTMIIRRVSESANEVVITLAQGESSVTRQHADGDAAPARFDTLVIGLQAGVSAVEVEGVTVRIEPRP